MRRSGTILLLLLGGCTSVVLECEGDGLFGRPSADTGLTDEQCKPSCGCDGEDWSPPTYIGADLDRLRLFPLEAAYPELTADPYDDTHAEARPEEVCGVARQPPMAIDRYTLATFESPSEALNQGAQVTHRGRCGLCSTLQDLAVYIEYGDLTKPVRACGLAHLLSSQADHVACLTDLGFTKPCAQIWYYNTKHTQSACADQCFSAIGEPYHSTDGKLNACLDCDEKRSGAVFKAVAGRTRRNSGLPTAICRPCNTVTPLAHDYR